MWLMLLFLAGITSSISLAQPAVAFLEDEFGLSKKRAVLLFAAATFLLCLPCIFWLGQGVVDEMDFWGGTFCLVLFGTAEAILFAWVFGMEGAWKDLFSGPGRLGARLRRFAARHNAMEEAWTELHVGSDITIPRVYRFIIKYITPAFLLVILGAWIWERCAPLLRAFEGASGEGPGGTLGGRGLRLVQAALGRALPWDQPYVLGTRVMLLGLFAVLALLVYHAWRRRSAVRA
jgi:SNF family Na+-dependent transporter